MTAAALEQRLSRLDPDQRAAATAEPGPILCVAAAGSGKTTTLVARICWLIATGRAEPGRVTAIAFNKRAAEEMTVRLDGALAEIGVAGGTVRVRTFHALGREILLDAGAPVEPLVDRGRLLQRLWPAAGTATWRALDTAISRLKLDLGVEAGEVAADAERGSLGDAFIRYQEALAAIGGLDFDDLVARALRLLETNAGLLARWRDRSFDLLVDEAQDLDRAQLGFALLLAAPANRIFLVGDDDQS
jgi:superfamily I DNA/RNA helicase